MRYLGKNGRVVKGEILFEGRDMLAMSADELRRIRGAEIAMVYQEPMASLNPSMQIGEQLAEVPIYHAGAQPARMPWRRPVTMLERVRLIGLRPHHELLSAPDLGRPAAARRHRDGACSRIRRSCCSTNPPPRST